MKSALEVFILVCAAITVACLFGTLYYLHRLRAINRQMDDLRSRW